MEDRRKQIMDAGLALVREEGLAGLTQPRIAARTGLRQSHLTYYYPTRAALVAAVARAAVDIQTAGIRAMAGHIASIEQAPKVIAHGSSQPENTRVLVALSQAAEQEPDVRMLFNELADGAIDAIKTMIGALGLESSTAKADLVQSLFIGLSIVQLATGRKDGRARAEAALELAFGMLDAERRSSETVTGVDERKTRMTKQSRRPAKASR